MKNRVYLGNFGKGNWAWPDCLRRGTITVMDDERVHPFWQKRDQEGYIEQAQKVLTLASGARVTKAVASRWYNVNTILMETAGDTWMHREKGEVWWTESVEAKPECTVVDDPSFAGSRIFLYHKRVNSWSNRNKKGGLLLWEGLHAHARQFLFTEATFIQLSDDHAAYARCLINGLDVSAWHGRPEWMSKADRAKRFPATSFDLGRRTIARMVATAMETAAQSGDISINQRKDKQVRFHDKFEFEKYLEMLLANQEGLCALTGLGLLFDDEGDSDLRCSLDRIRSDQPYERGNLQIVCKFANRWKGASDNEAFRRLIDKLRV